MVSVSEGTNLQKKRIRTLKKINLLTLPLLIYLVKSNLNNLPPIRAGSVEKTMIIKKVFDAVKNENKIAAITFL